MKPLTYGARSDAARQLQAAYNERADPRGWPTIKTDGIVGASTVLAVQRAARALGASEADLRKMRVDRKIYTDLQRIIIEPGSRSKAELARARARQNAKPKKPRIITSAQLGLSFQWVFGDVGSLTRNFGHYTAGPRARNATELVATARAVHRQHQAQGWGGGSYAVMVADDGTLLLLNPIGRKAAGVAGHNTGSVHLNVPGTTGNVMTPEAEATLAWYLANAHTNAIPKAYRAPRDLRKLTGRVHKDVNPTACPGDYTPAYRRVL